LGLVPPLSDSELSLISQRGAFLAVDDEMAREEREDFSVLAIDEPEIATVVLLHDKDDMIKTIGGVAFTLSGVRRADVVVFSWLSEYTDG